MSICTVLGLVVGEGLGLGLQMQVLSGQRAEGPQRGGVAQPNLTIQFTEVVYGMGQGLFRVIQAYM